MIVLALHRKILVSALLKERQNFAGLLYYNGDRSYLFVNGKKKFKVDSKNVTIPTQFCPGSISENN